MRLMLCEVTSVGIQRTDRPVGGRKPVRQLRVSRLIGGPGDGRAGCRDRGRGDSGEGEGSHQGERGGCGRAVQRGGDGGGLVRNSAPALAVKVAEVALAATLTEDGTVNRDGCAVGERHRGAAGGGFRQGDRAGGARVGSQAGGGTLKAGESHRSGRSHQ